MYIQQSIQWYTFSVTFQGTFQGTFQILLNDIFSGIFSDIFSGIFSSVFSGICIDVFSGVFSSLYGDIFGGIFSDIVSSIFSGILAIYSVVYSVLFGFYIQCQQDAQCFPVTQPTVVMPEQYHGRTRRYSAVMLVSRMRKPFPATSHTVILQEDHSGTHASTRRPETCKDRTQEWIKICAKCISSLSNKKKKAVWIGNVKLLIEWKQTHAAIAKYIWLLTTQWCYAQTEHNTRTAPAKTKI